MKNIVNTIVKELLSTHECNIYSNSDAAKFALSPSIWSPLVTPLSGLIFMFIEMYYPTQQMYDIKTLPPSPPPLSSSSSPYVKYDKILGQEIGRSLSESTADYSKDNNFNAAVAAAAVWQSETRYCTYCRLNHGCSFNFQLMCHIPRRLLYLYKELP